MPKKKTELSRCAGKLIVAIQKCWNESVGTDEGPEDEDKMNLAHDIQEAIYAGALQKFLGEKTVRQYLGEGWVDGHPNIIPTMNELQKMIDLELEDRSPSEFHETNDVND